MICRFRWKPITSAGCCLVFTLTSLLLAKEAPPAQFAATSDSATMYAVASVAATLDGDVDRVDPPADFPCSHGPCPPDVATFFSGHHGVLNKNVVGSFVHMMVGGQLHHAWLIQIPSHDPHYWLFEEFELPSAKIRRRWAVEKWGDCPNDCHRIWYRQMRYPEDEGNYWDWQLIECAHKTCIQPDAVPYPYNLGKQPKAPASYEGEREAPSSTPPKSGSGAPKDADGFYKRPPEVPPAKTPGTASQIERAPDAVEQKSALGAPN
jgi:hypothetical protein